MRSSTRKTTPTMMPIMVNTCNQTIIQILPSQWEAAMASR